MEIFSNFTNQYYWENYETFLTVEGYKYSLEKNKTKEKHTKPSKYTTNSLWHSITYWWWIDS